jgi:hypothetical protein
MGPLLAVGLVAGAAGAGLLYMRSRGLKGQVAGAAPGVVDTLTKGRSYAVMVTLTAQDGRGGQKPIGTINPEVASANLRNVYEVLGFKVLSAPVLRNASETSDFIHKNPSVWLFNGQWTKETGRIAAEPDFVLSHTFVTLPVQ